MTTDAGFNYVRRVDADALGMLPLADRYSQQLLDRGPGGRGASVAYIRTPPGGGSPRGTHAHPWDQIFYILEGTMMIEVEGKTMPAEPGSLVVFPAGVPHRNWNESSAPTVHLAFGAPPWLDVNPPETLAGP